MRGVFGRAARPRFATGGRRAVRSSPAARRFTPHVGASAAIALAAARLLLQQNNAQIYAFLSVKKIILDFIFLYWASDAKGGALVRRTEAAARREV